MEHVEHMLSSYLDNELDAAEKITVEKHLLTCIDCLTLYDDLSNVSNQLRLDYELTIVPDQITHQVMTIIHNRSEVPSFLTYTMLKWSTIGSILFLLSIHVSLVSLFGMLFSVTPIRIFYHLLYGALTILSAIPYLSLTISLTAFCLIGFSIWSLRHLLRSKKVEVI